MHPEAHAMVGWAIGNLPGASPQIRRYCTLGAILPDIDGLGFFISSGAYDAYHHTVGHNIFFAVLFAGFMAWRCRSWWAMILGALSIGSHLIADAGLSGWPVFLFYPVSGQAFFLPHSVGLSHPINIQLIYVGYVIVLVLALLCKRTPLELVSPRLDRLVTAILRARPHKCYQCGAGANLECDLCGKPVCLWHAKLTRSLEVECPACSDQLREAVADGSSFRQKP